MSKETESRSPLVECLSPSHLEKSSSVTISPMYKFEKNTYYCAGVKLSQTGNRKPAESLLAAGWR